MHKAAFVFTPQKKRGKNGVLLTQLVGIGDISKILDYFNLGYGCDLTFYPMGIPRGTCAIHNKFSASMIAGNWRKYT